MSSKQVNKYQIFSGTRENYYGQQVPSENILYCWRAESSEHGHFQGHLYASNGIARHNSRIESSLGSVLTTSTEIILETRKWGPCQKRVFIILKYRKLMRL